MSENYDLYYACDLCETKYPLEVILSIMPSEENDAVEVQNFADKHPLRRFRLKAEEGRCQGCQQKATGELLWMHPMHVFSP